MPGLDPKEILTAKQRPVAEAVAMTIGKVGENIVIGRATLYFSRPSVEIVGHTHPIGIIFIF
jgi:translation elongation factor EF-Ts